MDDGRWTFLTILVWEIVSLGFVAAFFYGFLLLVILQGPR